MLIISVYCGKIESGRKACSCPTPYTQRFPSVRTANLTEAEIFQKYLQEIHGMWESDRYINLLMGEIPRLRDDENGYGPAGKGFIAHVDIPENVEKAFSELKDIYGDKIREANPLYAQ